MGCLPAQRGRLPHPKTLKCITEENVADSSKTELPETRSFHDFTITDNGSTCFHHFPIMLITKIVKVDFCQPCSQELRTLFWGRQTPWAIAQNYVCTLQKHLVLFGCTTLVFRPCSPFALFLCASLMLFDCTTLVSRPQLIFYRFNLVQSGEATGSTLSVSSHFSLGHGIQRMSLFSHSAVCSLNKKNWKIQYPAT